MEGRDIMGDVKTKKQVIFRLEEDIHRKFQMYVLRRNTSLQELLEGMVLEKIDGTLNYSPHLISIVRKCIRTMEQEIKDALWKAYRRSITFQNEKKYYIQVFLDDLSEIHIEKSWMHHSLSEEQAYLLHEFESISACDVFERDATNIDPELFNIAVKSIDNYEENIKSYGLWLIKNNKLEYYYEWEDCTVESIINDIFSDMPNEQIIIDTFYQWNIAAAIQLKKGILHILETDYAFGREGKDSSHFKVKIADIFDEIIQREEFED